ncbi:MAG TPA: tripartite tricarboxylate transporter substrate-binding protein [Burkholderiales bacterium]|nr:tripartite tricarboxylate transporter substrate-binding protein [Burkholderiales bacterium]
MKKRLLLVALALLCLPARAQDYPTRPITLVVPAAAGGPTDTLARTLGAAMHPVLKQTFLIDNSGGAGGVIGINKAAKAKADGYTLLIYHLGMATAPALYRKLPYDTLNDFDYVGLVADVPMLLIAKKATAARNFAEFLDYLKVNQDKLAYSHAGVGSASFLCGLLFMNATQTSFTQVGYKGTGPAMNDLVGGQVDFMCDQATNSLPQVRSGNVKAYGVTTAARLASMPDLPTLDEQGLKGFDLVVWNGLFAPRGIPKPALDKLVAALQVAVQDPTFRTRMADLSSEPAAPARATPEALREVLKSEVAKWTPIIHKAGVHAD